jgi:hypothetical protein
MADKDELAREIDENLEFFLTRCFRMESFPFKRFQTNRLTLESFPMPCIWGTHNKSQVFIPVAILPVPSGATAPQVPLTSNIFIFNALMDTGAQSTCISRA